MKIDDDGDKKMINDNVDDDDEDEDEDEEEHEVFV